MPDCYNSAVRIIKWDRKIELSRNCEYLSPKSTNTLMPSIFFTIASIDHHVLCRLKNHRPGFIHPNCTFWNSILQFIKICIATEAIRGEDKIKLKVRVVIVKEEKLWNTDFADVITQKYSLIKRNGVNVHQWWLVLFVTIISTIMFKMPLQICYPTSSVSNEHVSFRNPIRIHFDNKSLEIMQKIFFLFFDYTTSTFREILHITEVLKHLKCLKANRRGLLTSRNPKTFRCS